MQNLKEKPFLLLLIGPVLLCLGWYVSPVFTFLGFVPLLFIDRYYSIHTTGWNKVTLFLFVYGYFLLWNLGVTWWIYNSTLFGAAMAVFCNSLLMCIPFYLFRFTKNTIIDKLDGFSFRWYLGYSTLPFYWIAFEYLHHSWDLTWPWLTLGNVFAFMPKVVQWYEYTGTLGGSLWILVANLYAFRVLNVAVVQNRKLVAPVILMFFPMVVSLIIYSNYQEKGKEVEVVVVQPNIDPYNEKFEGTKNFIPYDQQLDRLISLSKSKLNVSTDFLAWPETSLPANFDEDLIRNHRYIKKIRDFLRDYPNLTLVTGMDSYRIYLTQFDASPTARFSEGVGYHDYFNAALCINDYRVLQIYHKSKLVPGVEKLPFSKHLKFLENMAIDMGGITGSLGTQDKRTVFYNSQNIGIAPIICYESIFGEFVSEFVRNGADLIFIITNDGWWGNTPGYKQHLAYARLRAIETRKSIARAANTGISAFINQHGDVLVKSDYWKIDALRMTLKVNTENTFYTMHGDYPGTIAVWISSVVFITAAFMSALKKRYVRRLFKLNLPIHERKPGMP